MADGELTKQSVEFSIYLVDYYKWLICERKEFVMARQILKSGTSIGANLHEAKYAITKADFINKIHIALKEASETEYWLIVLEKTGYLDEEYKELEKRCLSLKKMLIATLKSSKYRK